MGLWSGEATTLDKRVILLEKMLQSEATVPIPKGRRDEGEGTACPLHLFLDRFPVQVRSG
jgi:hypothetical protein